MFSEADAEVQRIKLTVIKSEEDRLVMERKARLAKIEQNPHLFPKIHGPYLYIYIFRETELIVNRMAEEAEQRQAEANRLRSEVPNSQPINGCWRQYSKTNIAILI